MTNNTIAVVIPLRNKAHFVTRAVSSVLAQVRPPDEVIVVDDASKDGGVDLIAPLFDSRFKLLRRVEPGPGGYAARNLAIRSATSDWIAFLDADDSWRPEFLAEITRMIGNASDAVGCAFTGYQKIFSGGRVAQDRYSRRHAGAGIRDLDFNQFLSDWISFGSSPIWTSACAIRRDVLLQAGLFPEGRCRRAGDKDTWLRTMAQTRALCSPKPLATYYTVTENQVSRLETFNTAPCLCATVVELLTEASTQQAKLLKQLFDLEVFEYVLKIRSAEHVSPEVYKGFWPGSAPLRYLMLMALVHLPSPLPNIIRWCIFRGRKLTRRISLMR